MSRMVQQRLEKDGVAPSSSSSSKSVYEQGCTCIPRLSTCSCMQLSQALKCCSAMQLICACSKDLTEGWNARQSQGTVLACTQVLGRLTSAYV